jgi:signal transduction histidine kinase
MNQPAAVERDHTEEHVNGNGKPVDRRNHPAGMRECSSEIWGWLMATQEEERKAISRELHDSVVQSLTALVWDVANLRGRIPESDAKAYEILDSIQGLAQGTARQIRDLALLLRPSMLDDLGLTAAIRWQVREVSRRTGLTINISADEIPEDLPEGFGLCLYRLTQEALQNAVRHAKARTVYVELRYLRDRLLLDVRDDGIGFDAESDRGLGLLGMEERLRQVGGALRITSRPGMGTMVSAEVPFTELSRPDVILTPDRLP